MPLPEWYLKTWDNSHIMQSPAIRVQIDPEAISGATGTFGRSLFLPYILPKPETTSTPLRLISLGGWIGWSGETDHIAKLYIPLQAIWPAPQYRLQVSITDMQIEAIEENRKGNHVNLVVCLEGLASIGQALEPVHSTSSNWLCIKREHWLEVLQQLGAGTKRLVELPIPKLPQDDQVWAECMRLLDEATQLYRSGGYEHALKNCRSIIEGIPYVLCATWNLSRKGAGQSFDKWLQEIGSRLSNAWGKDDSTPVALQYLLIGAWKWLAPVPHYGAGIPLRETVTFALGLCTDLLHFTAQAIQAHSDPITSNS